MTEIQVVTLDIQEIPADIASQEEIASPASEVEAVLKSSLHRDLRRVVKVALKEW